MFSGRLRQCLKILRWDSSDLADELGRPECEVKTWIEGRAAAPLGVLAWIEALAKAHEMLPAPGRMASASNADAERIGSAEIRLSEPAIEAKARHGFPAFRSGPRRTAFADAARAQSVRAIALPKGGSGHGMRPL